MAPMAQKGTHESVTSKGSKVLHESLKDRECPAGCHHASEDQQQERTDGYRRIDCLSRPSSAGSGSDETQGATVHMQRLADVSDWSGVNIEGRVLEVLAETHFKLVMRAAWQVAC